MHRFLLALLFAATAGYALAGDPTPGAEPATRAEAPAAPAEVADQAALEAADVEPEHVGPTFGKSRVERRREKCRGQAQQQGLKGQALQQHMQGCVKR